MGAERLPGSCYCHSLSHIVDLVLSWIGILAMLRVDPEHVILIEHYDLPPGVW